MHIGILGGSFNPVHVGHIRLALEVLEACRAGLCAGLVNAVSSADSASSISPLQRMELVPSAQPPHKSGEDILPFDLRVQLLQAALHGGGHTGLPDMGAKPGPDLVVNELEGQRQGPSYTWDTLEAYRQTYPGARLLFVVGGEDFGTLSQWHRGLELPRLADIAMVPRAGSAQTAFRDEVARQWPEARLVQDARGLYAELPWGGRLLYLPLPRLDISASFIRQRWLAGRSIRFLVPDAVLDVLEAHHTVVTRCWRQQTIKAEHARNST